MGFYAPIRFGTLGHGFVVRLGIYGAWQLRLEKRHHEFFYASLGFGVPLSMDQNFQSQPRNFFNS
jgi:hypothetical protein